jgi:hypothetical protein
MLFSVIKAKILNSVFHTFKNMFIHSFSKIKCIDFYDCNQESPHLSNQVFLKTILLCIQ